MKKIEESKSACSTDVSVVIVNWNTLDLLRNCIKSIFEQTQNIRFEVIVVDNASTDGSPDMVRAQFPEVQLLVNSTNRGYGAAVNQGIEQTAGSYVLVLNSDTLICDRAIEKTFEYAQAHQDIAVLGPQVWLNDRAIQMTCFRFPDLLSLVLSMLTLNRLFKKSRFFGREWMLWWDRRSCQDVDVVSGMYMLVSRRAIQEVGPMDEAFFMYYEETDWCYRFKQAGWRNVFWPGARIVHCHGGGNSSKMVYIKMKVQQIKSLLIYMRKHYSLVHATAARLIIAVSSLLKLMVCIPMLLARQQERVGEAQLKMRKFLCLTGYCVFNTERGCSEV